MKSALGRGGERVADVDEVVGDDAEAHRGGDGDSLDAAGAGCRLVLLR
jgi:hypothetical protein